MDPVTIRPMTPADTPQALGLLARWNLVPVAPSAAVPEPERTALDPATTWVAEAGGRIVGVSSYILRGPEEAETASVVVEPAYLRRGVLSRLTAAKLAQLRRLGVKRLVAETDRPGTVRWMVGRLGYRVIGHTPKRHAFGRPDVGEWTVLELDLERAPARDLGDHEETPWTS